MQPIKSHILHFFFNADNKIKAKTFITDLSESDFDSTEFGNFTVIGKRVLKRLFRQVHLFYVYFGF